MLHAWAGQIWGGVYVGQYPYPLIASLAPISFLPLDLAAIICLLLMLAAVVFALKRDSLYWIFFVPLLQCFFLGQLDPFFWLIYRSSRPAVWALLSLKPQLLLPALPRVFASKRNLAEFLVATLALQVPFLLLRPSWPMEWISFLSGFEQNRITRVASATTSGSIMSSSWLLPFFACLLVLVWLRRKNLEGALFLANPILLPYDYSLLLGGVSRIFIPLSWLALALAWRVQAGWPYALMLIGVLLFETVRERRTGAAGPGSLAAA
ncbi:MAG: hypothetical protein V1755_06965 [Chloroflexota bacterium]